MNKLRTATIGLTIAAAALLVGAPRDLSELRPLLLNRTDEAHKALGIVVGLVDATGERFIASGVTAPGGTVAPDADTVFEIGSITKVFTSLVLADMVVRGEVKLEDPVAKFLPQTVRVPSRGGREITLLDLSNQVSGLPRLPDNLKPADQNDPYADYGPAKLYEFLSGYTLTRDIGEKYEYSNLGVGLLGQALALKAGLSYEELVRRRVLEPLGMTDTTITLTEAQKKRLAAGSNPSLRPVGNWRFDALAGAGALLSTSRDMLKLLTAAMGLRETPLQRAFDLMLRKDGRPGLRTSTSPWAGTSGPDTGRRSSGTTAARAGIGRSRASIQRPRRGSSSCAIRPSASTTSAFTRSNRSGPWGDSGRRSSGSRSPWTSLCSRATSENTSSGLISRSR